MLTSSHSCKETGLFINQPSGDVAPVGLGATTLYTGLYATDTLDVTSRLSVTAGARYNFAQINLTDQLMTPCSKAITPTPISIL